MEAVQEASRRRHFINYCARSVLHSGIRDFLSTHDPYERHLDHIYLSPQIVRPFDGWKFAPYVQGVKSHRNPETYRMIHSVDPSVRHRVNFFVRGHEYKLLGIFRTDIHLMGADADVPFYILGSDRMGRDMWSRIAYGARISLTVGLVGVTISLFLGRADRWHFRTLRRHD